MNLLLQRRRQMMAKQEGGGSILPAGYTQYDWIECTDTTATSYIDTGFNPTKKTSQPSYVFEGMFAKAGTLTASYDVRGIFLNSAANNVCNYGLMRAANTEKNLSFNYNGRASASSYGGAMSGVVINNGKWHEFNLHSTEGVVNGGTITFDAEDYSYTITTPNAASGNTKLLYGYPCRLARFKISEGGALVADLVPAVRDSDSVVGFYDIVRETFYPPTGEATFTAGYGFEDFAV